MAYMNTNNTSASDLTMDSMREAMRAMEAIPRLRETIWANPYWREWILAKIGRADLCGMPPGYMPLGIPIEFSKACPRYHTRWQFPRDPHFIYDPEDEDWCRYFGIGRDVETGEPAIFVMSDDLSMTPHRRW